jgi:hypothetical protein
VPKEQSAEPPPSSREDPGRRLQTRLLVFGKGQIMNTRPKIVAERKRANPRIGFFIHLLVYVLVNALLVAINLSTSTAHLWFKWPLLGWGVGVLLHGLAVFFLANRRDSLPG